MEVNKQNIIDRFIKIKTKLYGENKIPSQKTLNMNSSMILKLFRYFNTKNKDTPYTNYQFIYEVKEIEDYLKDMSVSTQRNYYSVILSLVNYDKHFKNMKNDNYIELYVDKIKTNEAKKKDNESKGIMNDKKTEKLDITNEDMNNFMKTLLKNGLMKEYVIMTILNQYPIRAEISNVKFIDLKTYNKMKKNKDFVNNNTNYIVYGSKKILLSRGDYKTFKIYGRLENEMTGKAKSVLNKYIKDNDFKNGDSLFDMTNDTLTKRLFYISNKYLNIPLSVNSIAKLTIRNMLEDIKQTEEYKKNTTNHILLQNQVVNKVAKIRGTSAQMIYNSYVR